MSENDDQFVLLAVWRHIHINVYSFVYTFTKLHDGRISSNLTCQRIFIFLSLFIIELKLVVYGV